MASRRRTLGALGVLGALLGASVTRVPRYEALLGYTEWRCGSQLLPTAWVRVDLEPSAKLAVEAHERQHVADMRRNSCMRETALFLTSASHRLWIESRGFCRSAQSFAEQRVLTLDRALEAAAVDLAWGYSFGLTPGEAEVRIRAACADLAAGR